MTSLRKTCHSLRNFIDDTLPDPSILSITIIVEPEIISLDLNFSKSDLPLGIVYHKKEFGVLVEKVMQFEEDTVSPQTLKFLEILEFMDSFFIDFEVFLRFLKSQKSEIQHFEFTLCGVDGSEFSSRIQKILQKNQVLKSSNLTLKIHRASEVMSFLPYFSAGILKKIEISNSKRTDFDLNLEQVSELEQWKKAKILIVNFFTVRGPRKFLDSEKSVANFMTITVDDARMLIENFRSSPNFKSCKFNFIYIDEPILGALGAHPFVDQDYLGRGRTRWFWKTVDPEKLLIIEFNHSFILFKTVGWEGFPQNAIVQGWYSKK